MQGPSYFGPQGPLWAHVYPLIHQPSKNTQRLQNRGLLFGKRSTKSQLSSFQLMLCLLTVNLQLY